MKPKKYKTIEKVEMSKMPMVNPLFQQIIIYRYKFVFKKWVNRRHFFTDKKILQKFGLAAEVISV